MKKLLLSVMVLGVTLSLAGSAHAFQPSGWVYHDYPWAYDSGSGDWHWFEPGDTQWIAHMDSGQWAVMPESSMASGWVYYLWPFAYTQASDAWHWINEPDTQWVVNMRTGQWSRFGDPVADPDPDPDPESAVMIPGGTISGTNPLADGEAHEDWYPATYDITVDSFYMDKYLVTKGLWDDVRNDPATAQRGYTDLPIGGGQGIDHPVHTVSWFDAVKWLNARSEGAGREPVYYTDAAFTHVYQTGETWDPYVKTTANGYRLPTMDQWEYAARGGLDSKRFPWGDRIDHDNANYKAYNSWYEYDDGPDGGAYHPEGLETAGSIPHTTPVDYFPANNYGVHDMAGNLWEWNYDWHPSNVDSDRVYRGGSWYSYAIGCRVAARNHDYPGGVGSIGFRAVLPAQ